MITDDNAKLFDSVWAEHRAAARERRALELRIERANDTPELRARYTEIVAEAIKHEIRLLTVEERRRVFEEALTNHRGSPVPAPGGVRSGRAP